MQGHPAEALCRAAETRLLPLRTCTSTRGRPADWPAEAAGAFRGSAVRLRGAEAVLRRVAEAVRRARCRGRVAACCRGRVTKRQTPFRHIHLILLPRVRDGGPGRPGPRPGGEARGPAGARRGLWASTSVPPGGPARSSGSLMTAPVWGEVCWRICARALCCI